MTFAKDVSRLFTLCDGEGLFAADIAAWFPYTDQDGLKLCASLSTEPGDVGVVLRLHNFCTQNHRFPNKGWVCMTRRVGRKLCKHGVVMRDMLDNLNMFTYLNLWYSYKGAPFVKLSFPIGIQVSDDKPCAAITVQIGLEDLADPEIVITVHEKCSDFGYKPYVYSTKENGKFTKAAISGFEDDRLTIFTPRSTEDEARISRCIVCNETVKTIACTPEDVML